MSKILVVNGKWGQVLNLAPSYLLSDPCTIQDLTPSVTEAES